MQDSTKKGSIVHEWQITKNEQNGKLQNRILT